MYKLYGEHACTACLVAQNVLKAKKVEFTYQHLNELPEEEQDLLVAQAMEQKKMKLPLIVKNNKFYFLEEIV